MNKPELPWSGLPPHALDSDRKEFTASKDHLPPRIPLQFQATTEERHVLLQSLSSGRAPAPKNLSHKLPQSFSGDESFSLALVRWTCRFGAWGWKQSNNEASIACIPCTDPGMTALEVQSLAADSRHRRVLHARRWLSPAGSASSA